MLLAVPILKRYMEFKPLVHSIHKVADASYPHQRCASLPSADAHFGDRLRQPIGRGDGQLRLILRHIDLDEGSY